MPQNNQESTHIAFVQITVPMGHWEFWSLSVIEGNSWSELKHR